MTREEYEAKRNARYQRLLAAADKRAQESNSLFSSAHAQLSMIPLGQPILVGHHSEGRHRKAIASADNKYRRGFELHKQAEKLRASAQAAQNGEVIYSEDPDAVEKLQTEIADAELRLARMKATNTFLKTKNKKVLEDVGLTPESIIGAFQPFTIRNLSANIRRMKLRIEQVKARQSIPYRREEINGVVIEQNPDAMRTQITFDGKPSAEVIKKLKQSGFKWSPYEKVWQRLISNYAYLNACAIVKESKSL